MRICGDLVLRNGLGFEGWIDRLEKQQAAFAQKAHWFRVLSRLAAKNEQAATLKQKAPLAGGAEWKRP